MVLSLLQNVALLVALAAFQQFIVRRWKVGALPHTAVSGLLFGGATVLGMMTRVQAAPGIFYDGRSIRSERSWSVVSCWTRRSVWPPSVRYAG
ncbi:MAG: hypothetical protein ACYC52_10885 [Coriobacteriia bacterium]